MPTAPCAACKDTVPRVDFTHPNLRDEVTRHLRSDGVVVVENVLSAAECDATMEHLFDSFHALCPAVTRDPESWQRGNLPSGPPTVGMYHSLVAQFPIVWRIRSDDRVRAVFQHAYSGLRGREITRFVTSCDGINVKPPTAPFHNPDRDWAHVDQTHDIDNISKCIQGQVVLTNTTAAFRCSPKSHTHMQEFLDAERAGGRKVVGDFHLFTRQTLDDIKTRVCDEGGAFQTCVHTNKGSLILWLSSLVHSAKGQDEGAPIDRSDPWSQWRGVVYVCHRPREDVTHEHTEVLEKAFETNRVTPHWGSSLFSLPVRRSTSEDTALLARVSENPKEAYDIEQLRPTRTPRINALLLGEEWPTDTSDPDLAQPPITHDTLVH
ncbi:hypothetical protein PTSG_07949 [Salpingoeca rosetta]|uniref:Uncharacterized protein n=1 Tax=Salpingoeca rosetta (strain ATCC 50818 / BSB-021) TaxID=946362 RepID=F2UGT0_SALR5|nr:uncharacterized protein PTSG_07949 [Salpingoeca rosetta]EGD75830.1 hypothetical protein PTSG_07949 [Salpingoeca rosetta]|eukprot:XP_004991751.1 hypothetical protein PTSG_07949 [Salpingoeca rosetta]